MKRSSLFVCCGITLLYLSPRLDSMTVSPIVYLTTTVIPNVVDSAGYYGGDVGGQSGYYDDGVSGQSGYYGSGAGGKSGYYGGASGLQSRNYVSGNVPTGHYGGRPSTAAATSYGSYGHRTMPESAVQRAIRPARNERSHALYESPSTYEYMSNPPRKNGKISRVPETERLPPGDDVEFIDDRGGGGGGDIRRPAKDRHRDGNDSDDYEDRPRGHQQNNNGNSKRTNRNKSKTKNGGVQSTREDDYTVDDGAGGGDAEPVGSSTRGDVRKGATAKKPHQNGRKRIVRKNKNHRPNGEVPVKHKIHKKNEYSKRQQFFDEEHVDHGKKKPVNKTNHDGRKNNGHEVRKQSKKKRQQQQQRSTEKPVKRTPKMEKRNDQGTSRVVSQGYGQIVAVR